MFLIFTYLVIRKKSCFLVSCLIVLSFYSVKAQQSESTKQVTRFLEIGVTANAYRGDLSTENPKWSSAFHAGLKLNFKKRLNSHLNIGIGTLTGENLNYKVAMEISPEPTPNTFFKTSFVTVNYDLQVHLLKYKGLMVYLSQGFGIIRYEPKNVENNKLLNNFSTRASNESYSNVSVVLPTQAGVNYIFNNGYGVGLQAGWLNSQTDYLDNISQWGNRSKKDNALLFRFAFMIPLTYN